jgi:hypothetical protein
VTDRLTRVLLAGVLVVLAAIFRDDWLPLWEQFQRDEASRLKPEVLV